MILTEFMNGCIHYWMHLIILAFFVEHTKQSGWREMSGDQGKWGVGYKDSL